MAYLYREKVLGSLKFADNPQRTIDFQPFEFSERILGFYCGSPLNAKQNLDWQVQDKTIPVELLSCEQLNGVSGFRARLATLEPDAAIPQLLDIDPHTGHLKYLRADGQLQAVRFETPLNIKVLASTFGSQIKFRFDCLNLSKTGLLLASNRASDRAPFIQGTLLELAVSYPDAPVASIKLMGKVIRVNHVRPTEVPFVRERHLFGVQLISGIHSEAMARDWPQIVSLIERYHLFANQFSNVA